MISYAIIHRQGADRFLREAVRAGFDGLIVPDLPVEESESLCRLATALDLRLIQLITPTTPRDRAVRIARSTTGFIYYVSVAGITGERRSLPPELAENVAWLRTQTDLPICIGFGIGSADQIRELAPVADGLIVGSALVRRLAVGGDPDRRPTSSARSATSWPTWPRGLNLEPASQVTLATTIGATSRSPAYSASRSTRASIPAVGGSAWIVCPLNHSWADA